LSGSEVLAILEQTGFVVTRTKGSHFRLKLVLPDRTCYTSVPVHGSKALPAGTLLAIYRQASACVAEEELRVYFFTE
jgi:predicted RNA binding protein YcfA (HicA-like mRNA interferase family)